MIEFIECDGEKYPAWQASHNAARFTIPFAKEVCIGKGLDIGAGKKEWAFPGALHIDINDNTNPYDADYLPLNGNDGWDYIFSSHCLEHLNSWIGALAYWKYFIKSSGILYLYLPDPSQRYWRPYNNKKHKHILYSHDVVDYLKILKFKTVLVSGIDLNHSYTIIAEK